MKVRVTPELDQLMWMLAEQGDSRAVEEFEARHPEHKYELARRVAMVRGFRSEGARVHRQVPPPRFRPREARRTAAPRRLVFAVGALCLAAVAVATYTITTFLQPAPASVPQKTVFVQKTEPKPVEPEPEQIPSPQFPPVVNNPEPKPTVLPPYMKPQDMQVESAPLLTALEMIAAQGQIGLTVAPGMPNPAVRFSFHGRTTMEMLEKLGQAYNFTPFDQGDGTILVIPATDPKERKETPPNTAGGTPSERVDTGPGTDKVRRDEGLAPAKTPE